MTRCSAPAVDSDASGDNLYGPRSCWQPFVDFVWDAYDFDQGDWDDGFGFDNCCDVSLPLARTLNGLYALEYSAPDPNNEDWSMPIINWAGRFAREHIDELDARCGDGSAWATTRHGSPIDNWTELYLGFFYDEQTVERASTIIHEARHASGCSHDDGNNDSSWGYNGAWAYDVAWLAWFMNQCPNTSQAMKEIALARANLILDTYFTAEPGFRLDANGFPVPPP